MCGQNCEWLEFLAKLKCSWLIQLGQQNALRYKLSYHTNPYRYSGFRAKNRYKYIKMMHNNDNKSCIIYQVNQQPSNSSVWDKFPLGKWNLFFFSSNECAVWSLSKGDWQCNTMSIEAWQPVCFEHGAFDWPASGSSVVRTEQPIFTLRIFILPRVAENERLQTLLCTTEVPQQRAYYKHAMMSTLELRPSVLCDVSLFRDGS